MAIEKFIPEIWAKQFDKELEEDLVFYENCTHKYEGIAKQPGDTVKILAIGQPSLTHYGDGKLHNAPTPEAIQDMSQTMPIRQVDEFAFYVDDLEKRQAEGGAGLLSEYMRGAKFQVAEAQDSYIAGLAASKGYDHATKTFSVTQSPNCETVDDSAAALTNSTILTKIDNLLVKLLENKVSRNAGITLTLPPAAIMMIKQNYVNLDTDNSVMMKNGKVGVYNGITLKESVNCCQYASGQSTIFECQIKTNDAIAFVKPYLHLESYRPQANFTDAVKGYSLYDGKIVRPEQIVNWKFKLA